MKKINANQSESKEFEYVMLPLDMLVSNPNHLFPAFDDINHEKLKKHISKYGIMHWIFVHPTDDSGEKFTIIDGHKRIRAARELGWSAIRVGILRGFTAEEAGEFMLTMNVNWRTFAEFPLSIQTNILSAWQRLIERKSQETPEEPYYGKDIVTDMLKIISRQQNPQ